MSRRLAATIRRFRRAVRGWRAMRALSRVEKERQRELRRERIEAGQPEGVYEGLLAIGYECRQLGAELKAMLPAWSSGSGGGYLDGARDVVAAVDEAAGDLNLEREEREFGPETEPGPVASLDPDRNIEPKFDPWTAGEARERE